MRQDDTKALSLEDLIARHGLRRGRERAMHSGRATGHADLDACLPGGGLPQAALTEIVPQPAGCGELALLLPLLAAAIAGNRRVALVDSPCPLHAPALAGPGLRLDRVLLVQAGGAAANLWAAEQLLRSPLFGAVLCWTPVASQAIRRLQVAAETGGGIGVLYRQPTQKRESSMAALRLAVAPDADGIQVTVLKCRGPAGASVHCRLPGGEAIAAAVPVKESNPDVAVPASAALRA